MLRATLRVKIALLMILGLSTVGVNLFGSTSACNQCAVIRDSNGWQIGYGCVSGFSWGWASCTASASGCTTSIFCHT